MTKKQNLSEDDVFELAKTMDASQKPVNEQGQKNYVKEEEYYSEFQEVDLKAEEQIRWNALMEDFKKERILEGFLYEAAPNETYTRVDLVTEIHGFTVIIPDFEYFLPSTFKKDYYTAPEQDKFRRRLQMARNRLYSRIRFVISGAEVLDTPDGKEYKVFASRLKAMERIQEEWKNGNKKHGPLKKGDVIDLSVISVGELYAILDGFGMELILKYDKINAFKYVTDVGDELQVGDTVQTVVQKLYFNDDGSYYIEISSAAIGLSEIEKKNAEVRRGGSYTGVVMNYNPSVKKYTVIIQSKKARVTVNADSVVGRKQKLQRGDIVSVVITNSNSNKNINYGTARYLRSGSY